jgi:peroxisomal 3,2-trans-enoyl-CoA isomerase
MEGGQGLKLGEGNALDPVGIFMRTFIRFPKPIIAAVNGPAIGVGCTMVPHCDIVYAAENASFLVPFSRIAVVPEFCSSVTFPQILGTSTANEMLLFGKQLGAQRAKELGFVSDVFPQKNFLESVLREVRAGLVFPLLDKTLPLFKHMVKKWNIDHMERLALYELRKLDERADSGEIAEAVLLFMQKSTGKKSSL